jgi:UDPglucose 6-dehydrogenase
MKISIIGCGYVGIVTGVCLANSGHKIYFFDQNKKKLENIKFGKNLIFEKNLKNKLDLAKKKNNIFFCDTLGEVIKNSEVSFICVGTPLKKNDIELQFIRKVTIHLGKKIKQKKNFSIIYKSTIPPLTVEKICIPILRKELGEKIDKNFNVIFNPEFLREGNAIYDFENPKRIIAGIRNKKSRVILEKIYKKYKKNSKLIFVDIKTAEFIKYYSNAFFSLLISYSNEIANFCNKIGIDYI